MNKQTILSLACLLSCIGAHAQAPANAVQVATEVGTNPLTTVASTTGANVVYYWGSGSKFVLVPPVTYPLVVSCLNNNPITCPKMGGDPTPGVAKVLYAVEQATAYTVTLGDGTVVKVPALATPATSTPTLSPASTPMPVATAPTLLGTFTCPVQMYSDMTFTANSSQCVAVKP